jgi:hypothetical protein
VHTVPSPAGDSEVHLKFRTDLHIDLLGQSAEQRGDSTRLHTLVRVGGSGTACKLAVE